MLSKAKLRKAEEMARRYYANPQRTDDEAVEVILAYGDEPTPRLISERHDGRSAPVSG